MKKLLVIALIALFAVGMFGIEAFAKNPSGPGLPGDLMGMLTGRTIADPQRTFRIVRWVGGSGNYNLTADSIVIWDSTYDDGVTIATTTTSGDSRVAGVLRTAINSSDNTSQTRLASDDAGKANWGYLQTYGLASVNVGSRCGAPTVGYAMGTGPTPGCAGVFSTDSIGQPGYLPQSCGIAGFFYDTGTPFAADSSTADQSLECFVKCE